ncbi:hypothetical protein G5B38_15535 [Pseudohalocynthiibacter aestuariivivens]|uniref:Uncharacterized protein n=1 Tax=Roseovarius pelagicus TaxID=2980108 RepID=A0ABY6DET1_9RHOB|nr:MULTISPECIES: hypothetical protein [Rhodobacterales]QIE46821.1 hypothetical protein G5B38_15535 [Pseudohalocynthiibacter aestuariivivens]UXX84638.1 hypothetical protein N7U68_08385 [Roseovarius pelagicus]
MRVVLGLIAGLAATPTLAQTQDQVNALISQCIFSHTEATQIIFSTEKRESGAIAIKFDNRMGLSSAEKDTVRNCVAQGLS